jgi:hypothetical protein
MARKVKPRCEWCRQRHLPLEPCYPRQRRYYEKNRGKYRKWAREAMRRKRAKDKEG